MSAAEKIVECEHCGTLIAVYDDGGTVKKYCNRHCRNEAKKQRHREKMVQLKFEEQRS